MKSRRWHYKTIVLLALSNCFEAASGSFSLVGVTDPAAPGLVVVVADLLPAITAEFCPTMEQPADAATRQRQGDWVLDSAMHRGVPRKFWYNEQTHESRWADKFRPARGRSTTTAAPASTSGSTSGKDIVAKLREALRPLTYDNVMPICAGNSSSAAFVGHRLAPPQFCAHFLGITPTINRRRIFGTQSPKGFHFDQFLLEHTLLQKFVNLATVRCDDDDNNGATVPAVCAAQLAKADVVVFPSLTFHCTANADHGFMNKLLKVVLTPKAHAGYWAHVRAALNSSATISSYQAAAGVASSTEAYSKPLISSTLPRVPPPPLVVVTHRFVWDLPHFTQMLHSLVESDAHDRSSRFARRVVVPGLESSLQARERALFPPGWDGFFTSQLRLRQKARSAPTTLSDTKDHVGSIGSSSWIKGSLETIASPLLVAMPYPVPVLDAVPWSTFDPSANAAATAVTATGSPFSKHSSSSRRTVSAPKKRASNPYSSAPYPPSRRRPVLLLLFGDGNKPAPGRAAARASLATSRVDPGCADTTSQVCWVCDHGDIASSSSSSNDVEIRSNRSEAERTVANHAHARSVRAAYFKTPRFMGRRPLSKDRRLPRSFDVATWLASIGQSAAEVGKEGTKKSEKLVPGGLAFVRGLNVAPVVDRAPDVVPGNGPQHQHQQHQQQRQLDVTSSSASDAVHPLQEYAGVVGLIVEVMDTTSSPNGGASDVRVLLGHDIWRLPAGMLEAEDTQVHGSLSCGSSVSLLRSSHLWRLTASATFCVEPAGDTPTRSHFYVAALSGCIPVLLDGDAPQYHRSSTPWAFRSYHSSNSNNFDKGGEVQSSSSNARTSGDHVASSWAGLDYRKFTVRLNASALAAGDISLAAALQEVPLARIAEMRHHLDAISPLLRYSPHVAQRHDHELGGFTASGLAAAAVGTASTRQPSPHADAFGALLSILEVTRRIDNGKDVSGSEL